MSDKDNYVLIREQRGNLKTVIRLLTEVNDATHREDNELRDIILSSVLRRLQGVIDELNILRALYE